MPAHLPDLLAEFAASAPEKPVFTFLHAEREDEIVTAGQLHHDARVLSATLRDRGVKPGAILPLAFDHGYELVATFWGAMYLGAVPTILPYISRDSRSKDYLEQVTRLLRFTQASTVVTTCELESCLRAGLEGSSAQIVALASAPIEGTEDDSESWRRRAPTEPPYIQFSSGSTGSPKGVLLSHTAVLHYELGIYAPWATPEDVGVGWLPLYHDMGLTNQILRPLSARNHCVLMSPAAWLSEPYRLFQAIHRFRGTVTWMPNFAFSYCTRRVRDEQIAGVDLSTWRLLGNGSEPVFARDMEAFLHRFAAYGLRRGALCISFGLAEHVAAVTHTDGFPNLDWVSEAELARGRAAPGEANQPGNRAVVACGAPMPTIQVRIVDDAGEDLQERQVGEILVRSPSVFDGYYANPAETAAAKTGDWLVSGDLGYLARGQLYVCGRKKDLIIVGGRNLHPNHLEEVAAAVLGASCRFAAAFGLPNPRLGTEMPVVVCELRQLPDQATGDRLRQEIRDQIRRAHRIFVGDVALVPPGWILKTTSGKINRSGNREKYLAEADSRDLGAKLVEPAAPLSSTERRLLHLWESLLRRRDIRLDDDFFELGGDSLLAAELSVAIEEMFRRSLPGTALLDTPTISGLARLLDTGEAPAAARPLVPLRAGHSASARPPFFCVHGLGGGVLDYRALSQALGPEKPFYGLQALGLDGRTPVDTSIGQMARHYVATIRTVQPAGPYHLGGYCFGGVVAFEMARQLRAAGDEVALVAILEGYAPDADTGRTTPARAWRFAFHFLLGLPYWLRDYLQLGRVQMRARNRRLLRVARQRLLNLVGLRLDHEVENFLDAVPSRPAEIQRLLTSHLAAIGRYAPGRYDGALVLFRTPQRLLRAPGRDRGWGALSSQPLAIEIVAGSHGTILEEPHVKVLARKLAPFLAPGR